MDYVERICVIGCGYIGLPIAVVAARAGYDVVGIDSDKKKLASLQALDFDFGEQSVNALLDEVVTSGRLRFGADIELASVYVVCVPTPVYQLATKESFGADLSMVEAVLSRLAQIAISGQLIIVESTVTVGATKNWYEKYGFQESGVLMGCSPERIFPGNVIEELKHNSRAIGGVDEIASDRMSEFYSEFVDGELIICTSTEAELIKLVENSFRDVNIAFANQVSLIADKLGVNCDRVLSIANTHPRVDILNPGIGVGGHCIPVDPWFLIEACKNDARLLLAARKLNRSIPSIVASHIVDRLSSEQINKIYIFGLTYKPDVADRRGSPAYEIFSIIRDTLGTKTVIGVDPFVSLLDCTPNLDNTDIDREKDFGVILVNHTSLLHGDFYERFDPGKLLDFSCGLATRD